MVLVGSGIGVGGEGGLAVVQEQLGGAAVDEGAQRAKGRVQRDLQHLAHLLVEAVGHAPAVHGADPAGRVIAQLHAAGAVLTGEQGDFKIAV